MDNNLFENFIEKVFLGDEGNINTIFIECDLYFKRYKNFVIGIYDYEDFRQIFILKILRLIKNSKVAKIKNLNGYMHVMIKNIFNELIRKNDNYNKNINIDLYMDNMFFSDMKRDVEEEYIRNSEITEIRKEIIKIIKRLNDKERDIIKAHYFNEISIADYSRKNKINYYTCAKRLKRSERKILKNLNLHSVCRG